MSSILEVKVLVGEINFIIYVVHGNPVGGEFVVTAK
jgi:hypothetical protein